MGWFWLRVGRGFWAKVGKMGWAGEMVDWVCRHRKKAVKGGECGDLRIWGKIRDKVGIGRGGNGF